MFNAYPLDHASRTAGGKIMIERNEESTIEEDPTLSIDQQGDEENQKADHFNNFARDMELAIERARYGLYE